MRIKTRHGRERHGRGMLCVNPPLSTPKITLHTYVISSIKYFFFNITYVQVFSLQFLNRISSTLLQVMLSHSYLFWTLHTLSVLACIQYVPMTDYPTADSQLWRHCVSDYIPPVVCWLVLAQTAEDPLTAAARSSAFALQAILTGPGYEPTADAASVVLLISAFLLGHPPFQKNLKQCSFSVRNMTQTEPQQVKGHSTGRTGTKNVTRDKSRDQFTLNVNTLRTGDADLRF